MAKQATPEKRRQFLDVKYTIASDGTYTPYRIDVDDEQYAVQTQRIKEVSPGRWRYTVLADKREMYIYRSGDQ